jgi:hypothetical protein
MVTNRKSRVITLLLAMCLPFLSSLPYLVLANNPNPPTMRIPWLYGTYDISGRTYNCITHTGLDQYAVDFGLNTIGTRLAATFSGTIHASHNSDLGNYIWIDHGDGWVAVYGHVGTEDANHNSTDLGLRVPQGSHVEQGAFIGVSGNTGYFTTGPHLHFRVSYTDTGTTSEWSGVAKKPEPLSGVTGFGQWGSHDYSPSTQECVWGGRGPGWSAPAPGGWWLGPTPSDGALAQAGSQISITAHAEDNNNTGLEKVKITVYNPANGQWQVIKDQALASGITSVNVSTNYTMPSGVSNVLVSFDVYSRNKGFQLAPQGIRKFCTAAPCVHTSADNAVAYAYDGAGGAGGGGSDDPVVCSTPGTNQVTLYTGTNYSGSCVTKGVGEYLNPAATGLPNDSIRSVMVGNGAKVELCRDDNLSNTCEWLTDSDLDLSNNSVGSQTVSSVKIISLDPTTGCVPNDDQVAFYDDTNYGGTCALRGPGTYSNPSATGVANDSISSVKVGNNVKVNLCRDDNLSNTCEWFDYSDTDLSNNSVGSNQVSSAQVIYRGGIELCDGTNYGSPCQVFSEGSTNLSTYGWSDRTESVRYNTEYAGRYHIVLWTEANQTGNPYHADDNVADLGTAFRNHVRSIQIYKHQPPGPPSNPSPANGNVLPATTTNKTLTFNGADESRVHVWGNGYDYWRDWNASTSVSLTGLAPGKYYWQAQSRNIMGEGPWGPVWTFYVNRAPEVGAIADLTLTEGDSYSMVVSALDLDGTTPTLSASNLPSFATFTNNGNGTGTLTLNPSTSNAGTYQNVTITASDGTLTGLDTFIITVNPGNAVNLLSQPWDLQSNGGDTIGQAFHDPDVLAGKDMMRITYNLHGLTALNGLRSNISFEQDDAEKYISLSDYGQNGLNGWQTIEVPLKQFDYDNTQGIGDGEIWVHFWYGSAYHVEISSIVVYSTGGSELLTSTWDLQSNGGDTIGQVFHGPDVLAGKDTMRITYNLHGLTALDGLRSNISFEQDDAEKYISLADYGINGRNGWQTIDVPLSDFDYDDTLNIDNGEVWTHFWYGSPYHVEISSIIVYNRN